MANVNRPSGLSPVTSTGSPWTGPNHHYYIPSTDMNAWYIGDIVQTVGGADANGVPQIQKPTGNVTSGNFRGVIVGFTLNPNNLTQLYAPATKLQAYYAMVVDDPTAWFTVTDDGLTANKLVAASVNGNCGFTVATPSNTVVPYSATVLYSTSMATTNTLPLKIMGLNRVPFNTFGAYAQWLVKFNNHELNAAGTAGN